MADTLVKKPVLFVGTKEQINATTMGEDDFAIVTDEEFYTKAETDALFNGKADADLGNIPTNYDYVVESQLPTSSNGYTWYRKYKSGWVEQGGRSKRATQDVSVTFPVPFMDTNYNAQAIRIAGNVSSTGQEPVQIKEMFTTGLKISQYNSLDSSQSIQWQVSGHAAS